MPLKYKNIVVAAAKEDVVWPEGKEKSVGFLIKSSTLSIHDGLFLLKIGFNVRLHTMPLIKRAKIIFIDNSFLPVK